MSDRVLTLECENYDRSAAHELDQVGEEGTLPVDGVKSLGFPCAQVNLTHTENLEPLVQNALDDDALLSLLDDIGLDDCECSLFGHCGRIYTYSAERGQNLAQESRAL